MIYRLRDYQKSASDAAVGVFKSREKENYVIVLPTGAGEFLVIADIAAWVDGPLMAFQPSKEILEQNFTRLQSYGIFDCGVYSASAERKDINRITFTMIGSVMKHISFFKRFRHVLIDECHLVNPEKGMYKGFFEDEQREVIGLIATPYGLCSGGGGAMFKSITCTRPKVFTDVIYHCQVSELFAKGFLTSLKYYDVTKLDLNRVRTNSTGADYDEKSLLQEFERVDIYKGIVGWTKRLLNPESGMPCRGILIFTRFTREAKKLASETPNCAIVSGSTPKEGRAQILKGFKDGRIKIAANVGVLTIGFDYPELDTIVFAYPIGSLPLYYQMVGRIVHPYQGKEGWVVGLSGNFRHFGRIEELRIGQPERGEWCIMSRDRQLANVVS